MAPFIALVVSFVTFLALGLAGVARFAGPVAALRPALGVMLLLTASAHWGRRRADLVRMVPRSLPHPEWLVSATGLLELAAAIGLQLRALAPFAGAGLALLLVALFPANVRAARERLTIAGRPVPPLVPRAVLQLVFIAAALVAGLG